MTAVCPRCGSIDVHSSHAKGTADRILRLLALPPRRCSACGWRGYRPRVLFPSRHGSNPDVPMAKAPEPAPEPAPKPEPQGSSDGSHAERQRRHRRRRRYHNLVRSKNGWWKVAILAVGLGAALGYVVLGMGN